jgi:hypothetical protein
MTISYVAISFSELFRTSTRQERAPRRTGRLRSSQKGGDQSIDHMNLSVSSLAIVEAAPSTSQKRLSSISRSFFVDILGDRGVIYGPAASAAE